MNAQSMKNRVKMSDKEFSWALNKIGCVGTSVTLKAVREANEQSPFRNFLKKKYPDCATPVRERRIRDVLAKKLTRWVPGSLLFLDLGYI